MLSDSKWNSYFVIERDLWPWGCSAISIMRMPVEDKQPEAEFSLVTCCDSSSE